MFESDEKYYADREYLTNSSLKLLHSSPSRFDLWFNKRLRDEKSDALEIGKAFHALSLEDKITFVGYEGTRRGKDYMSFCEENSDKIILTEKDANMIYRMIDKLKSCKQVNDLMAREDDFNMVEIPETGLWDGIKIKGKADMLVQRNSGERFLVDIKTTAAEIGEFSRSAKYMYYDQQAAFYNHLFGVDRFVFVVIRKLYPYDIGIFECSNEFIMGGRRKAQIAINKYKDLFIDNNYDPTSPTETAIL